MKGKVKLSYFLGQDQFFSGEGTTGYFHQEKRILGEVIIKDNKRKSPETPKESFVDTYLNKRQVK